MTHVLTVIGARPQFIKASPVSAAMAAHDLRETVVHTGQHYDVSMSQIFFDELGMRAPDVHLNVGSGRHGEQTARMLSAIELALLEHRPDVVLTYGDTNSTLAGALAAAKLHIPVAHVEAGLRSGNMRMPEEVNRIVTDALSDSLFAPTRVAIDHLLREGKSPASILDTGDVMYDAALMHGRAADERSTIRAARALGTGEYILATVHRAENTDDPHRLRVILEAFGALSRRHRLILPLHPRTRNIIQSDAALRTRLGAAEVIDPVGYLDMIALERGAAVILTDSGGVQKEAFFHQVPCVTLRDETEWTELVTLGWNRLCPPNDPDEIVRATESAMSVRGTAGNPYGRGDASLQIARHLAAHY